MRKLSNFILMKPTLIMAACISLCVLFLSSKVQEIDKKSLNDRLISIVLYAQKLIDMELHQQLTDKNQTNGPLYTEVIKPLVLLHNSLSQIQYLYTIIILDDKLYFILDTANSELIVNHEGLEASLVMEEYDPSGTHPDWLKTVMRGENFIDHELFTDQYGTFISASAPLYDASGKVVGLVGIDMNAKEYIDFENRITVEATIALLIGVGCSIVFGIRARKKQNVVDSLQREQHNLTLTDSLTGALNRRYYNKQIEVVWSEYKQQSVPFSLISIDVDYFKNVNDTYGHAAGDDCLIHLAKIVQANLRENDTFIRMGGEEFIVIMSKTVLNGANNVAQRVRCNIEDTTITSDNGDEIKLTVSIGVACCRKSDLRFSDVVQRSDKALYSAKNQGRNSVAVLE